MRLSAIVDAGAHVAVLLAIPERKSVRRVLRMSDC